MNNNGKIFLIKNDPTIAEIINTIPEPNVKSTNDVFFDLMSCILEQQIHYRSTKRIFKRMLERSELTTLNPNNFDIFEEKAFPRISLSISKYETAQRLIEFWKENKIDWKSLNDEQVREKLSAIKGVGKWSVDMILLYTLERPNIFPYYDFHLKQIMGRLYGLDARSKLKAQMIDVSKNWGEYKSLAVKYLFDWKIYSKKITAISAG